MANLVEVCADGKNRIIGFDEIAGQLTSLILSTVLPDSDHILYYILGYLRWINSVNVNRGAVEARVRDLIECRPLSLECQVAWLLKAITCIDLTTLSGDDTAANVNRLCHKACHPLNRKLLAKLGLKDLLDLKVAAVCVYPNLVQECTYALRKYDPKGHIRIASVAAGFPSGQYPLETRLSEITLANTGGAQEIDVVINRQLALAGDWKGIYDELVSMRLACSGACLKVIVAAGELGTLSNVFKSSLVAMMAGADFIKTSTGKETVNATLPIGLVMTRAIRNFYLRTGQKVGFKPAGGIRTAKDVLQWQILMKEELSNNWLQPKLFRIGASALLADIEKELFKLFYGRQPAIWELPIIETSISS